MITIYATTKDGEGYCEGIGRCEEIDDFRIRIGMFSPDTVITFNTDMETENE